MTVSRQNWVWLGRLGCLCLSAIALWLILKRIHFSIVARTLGGLRPGWFAAAVLLYGMLFIPAAARWHLVLKPAGAAIRPMVTLRYTLIGHFFYTILFGPIGGDSAKVALYARRFRIPFARMLATAPLDRLFGWASSLVFALAFIFSALPRLKYHVPWATVILLVIAGAVLILLIRPLRFAPCRAFAQAFLDVGANILSSPRTLIIGVSCGFLTQAALAGVFAFNLLAISTEPLLLSQLFWCLPVIIAASSLPSIAGLGTREAAAIALLAPYGVSPAAATAASLLTGLVAIIWAVVAAVLIPEFDSWSKAFSPSTWGLAREKQIYSAP